ncbi:electron transport complex subunit RsxD [Planctobacterium marinum]|uniref:Ion-translocating oxidoreductase complex subunit D n=1 Tax=Planctobacterium marinum TaxID=1631968 RepID=A0AA48HX44_9ALTE|nr:electron transport complex subunit D [Planctobacterium marinum]
MKLFLASSPHLRQKRSTQEIMQLVMLFAVPGIAVQTWFFGFGTLINILIACLVAVVTEVLILELRKKNFELAVKDSSALVTALLLGISIPPFAPWWMTAIGAFFAIAIAKQLYGGLGFNLFNPAMTAYVVLLISFPVQMTAWAPVMELSQISHNLMDALSITFTGYTTEGYSVLQLRTNIDGFTMATPLDEIKNQLNKGLTVPEITSSALFIDAGNIAAGFGKGWFWINIAFLLGGFLLLQFNLINWHLPVGMLAGLGLPALLAWLVSPDTNVSPLLHLFSGGTMLGAFFIITDPVTAATSNKGRIIFGFGVGLWVYIIRTWGGYPDAIAFSVLLMNMCVPVIDYYTRPRTYGHNQQSSAQRKSGSNK